MQSAVKPQVTITPHCSSDRDNFYHHWLEFNYPVSFLQHLPIQPLSEPMCHLYCLALHILRPVGRQCISRLSCVQIIPIQGKRCGRFLRTAISIVSCRIRRHFLCSSFHHWINGKVDHKRDGTNLFTMISSVSMWLSTSSGTDEPWTCSNTFH